LLLSISILGSHPPPYLRCIPPNVYISVGSPKIFAVVAIMVFAAERRRMGKAKAAAAADSKSDGVAASVLTPSADAVADGV
jgi:hypothetical protein